MATLDRRPQRYHNGLSVVVLADLSDLGCGFPHRNLCTVGFFTIAFQDRGVIRTDRISQDNERVNRSRKFVEACMKIIQRLRCSSTSGIAFAKE